MKSQGWMSGCACCSLNRRQFLAASGAACASAAAFLNAPGLLLAAQQEGKPRIRVVYALHAAKQPGPDWPNVGFDFVPVMNQINSELSRRCPGFQFAASLANGPEQAQAILEEDKTAGIDGYIVCQMNCWNRVVQTIATSGKPVLYSDFLYGGSGGFLTYNAAFLRNKTPNVGFVSSSRVEDLAEAAKCFELVKKGGSARDFVDATTKVRISRTMPPTGLDCEPDQVKCITAADCLGRMKDSRILAVRGQDSGPAAPIMSIPMDYVSFAEVNEAWKAADRDQARSVADAWEKEAALVEGVDRKTIEASAAMYLGMKSVLKKHGANAITVNCLGGFYGGHIHAYPCLGFYQLLNEGLVGACECDVRSTAAMVALTAMTNGRPGYISDPVMDTSKRQIIYAHCVASNRAFGPKGRANPYQILTHSEDRQGASVRSILPLGYMTTTLEISQERKEILMHQGKAVANDPEDRACRTKIAAEPVGDFEKLFTEWDHWGWHRVTFYGDLKQQLYGLADALGWKVVEEA
jgi:hypothetical protein